MEQTLIHSLSQTNNIIDSLRLLSEEVKGKIVFSTSFGIEDQAITDAIFSQRLKNIEVFTLDTGRLFPETYSVWDKTVIQYNAAIQAYYPNATTMELFVNTNGINPFYSGVALRKECCHIRKVEPLQRALAGAAVWITGLRAEQSPNRNTVQMVEWDENFKLFKFNPLLHWSFEEVKSYVQTKGVPYNTLHDKGFVSIGCAPCTRAIQEGEDFRAGRWWWEDASKKECGLHK